MFDIYDFRQYSELFHHGIKGQKWGVKNGPPYPLNSKNLSKSISKKAKEEEPQITDDLKKVF